jgi:hypothetical protein
MRYYINFFEVQGQTEVFRFSKEMYFSNYDFLIKWVYEFLETSNIWKNCNMLIKIETMPTIQKSEFFYHAEQ